MSVDAPELIWLSSQPDYWESGIGTVFTFENGSHNMEYVRADKLEELASDLSASEAELLLVRKSRDKLKAALAEKDKEIEALRDALKQTVEIVRQHVPNIPPDGPTSTEHQSAYEAVGFALQDLERYVISRNDGGNPIYQGHPTEQERLYRNTEPRDGFVEEGIIPVDVWGPPMAGGEIFTIRASLAQEDGR